MIELRPELLPAPVCPACLGRECEPRTVSGRAQVHTFTINRHPWVSGFDPPYVVAVVELEEQVGLRLMTNIVGCDPDTVSIGMAVVADFAAQERDDGEAFAVPRFTPHEPSHMSPVT